MRFSSAIVALAALASSVVAQTPDFDGITSPTKDQEIPSGSSFDITWSPGSATGKVSISLLQGDSPTTLQVGPAVASSIDNSIGKYTWSVPASAFKTYGFKISLDSDPATFQYSNPFHISGASTSQPEGKKNTTLIATPTGKNTTSHTKTKSHAPTSTHKVSNHTRIVNSTTSAVPVSTPVSLPSSVNVLTTLTPSKTEVTPGSTSAPASTSSTIVKSNAVNTVVSSSFALIGGLVLAFAL